METKKIIAVILLLIAPVVLADEEISEEELEANINELVSKIESKVKDNPDGTGRYASSTPYDEKNIIIDSKIHTVRVTERSFLLRAGDPKKDEHTEYFLDNGTDGILERTLNVDKVSGDDVDFHISELELDLLMGCKALIDDKASMEMRDRMGEMGGTKRPSYTINCINNEKGEIRKLQFNPFRVGEPNPDVDGIKRTKQKWHNILKSIFERMGG